MNDTLNRAALDADGFLLDPADWSESLAQQLAREDAVHLGDDHWLVIRLARSYYQEYQVSPGMRILVALLRKYFAQPEASVSAPERIDSRYLYRLFSDSPGRQVCRYAGLPKPVSCI